jgi:glyoxylase-like metal-dependent hydrolase (beta-lactamase superfamily II)
LDGGVIRLRSRLLGQNSYLFQMGDGAFWWVDPGFDAPVFEEWLQADGRSLVGVLCTHGHFDHIAGAAWCQERFQVPVYLSHFDQQVARSSNFLLMAMKRLERVRLPEFTWMPLSDGGTWIVESDLMVESFPGHTPGSCVVRAGNRVFTGDTLYVSGMNFVSLPGENRGQLIESLRTLCASLAPDAWVYPGHGKHGRFVDIQLSNQELRSALAYG